MEVFQMNTDENVKNVPEVKFRAGAICAAVWSNEGINSKGENTSFKTISIERSYKDKNGEWQKTNSLRINDLPRAALVLNKAYEYLIFSARNGFAEAE